jgi:hypothetical protein
MPIQLTGSLDITGSISINGSTVSTGSGGSVSASVEAGGNFTYVLTNFNNPDYTINVPAASITDVHISQSGVYLISGSFTTTESASVNLYFYPDDLAVGDVAYCYFTAIGTVSNSSTRFTYTGILSGSASNRYFIKSANAPYASSLSFSFGQSNSETKVLTRGVFTGTYPGGIYKANSTDFYLFNIGDISSNIATFTYTGSFGTPIV